jgi:Uma2 family endonuclease
MSAALKWNLISVDDYLSGELLTPVKHEYVNGVVFAMAGARNSHNYIQSNIHVSIGRRLRGHRCRVHGSDTKVRIRQSNEIRFYYADTFVTCEQNPLSDTFQDNPVVLFEVFSKSTRRTDEGEKKDAYLTIPSLKVYAMVEQETAAMIVFRRVSKGFVREVYQGLGAVLSLSEIDTELPFAEVYDRVEFSPEKADD